MSMLVNPPPPAAVGRSGIAPIASIATVRAGSGSTSILAASNLKLALGFSNYEDTAEISIGTNTSTTVSHSLGVAPKFVMGFLVCKTAEYGYSVNDRIPFLTTVGATTTRPITITVTSADVTVSFSGALQVQDKTGGGAVNFTNANWRIVVTMWA